MTEMSLNQASPFICNLNAIDPDRRARHADATAELFQSVQVVHELPDGYAFRFPNEIRLLRKAVDFITDEKLCCPFFGFTLKIEPEGGPLWLYLTGREGVKPFIRAEMADVIGDAET